MRLIQHKNHSRPEELIAMHPDRAPSRRACLGALSLTMLLAGIAGCASSRGTSNDDTSAASRPRRDEWNEREEREKWQEEKHRDDEYKRMREREQRDKEQQMQSFKENLQRDARERERDERAAAQRRMSPMERLDQLNRQIKRPPYR